MSGLAEVCQLAQNLAGNNGWPVFPLGEDKKPRTPHGFKDATSDPERIGWLWRMYPGSLIGMPTGKPSGFSVLDVDVKHDTARVWWRQHEHLLPLTRTYRTRGGGMHLFFRHADGVKNSEGKLTPGVDTRGDGGYVVHWFAAGYECLDHAPLAEWPHWLSRRLWPPPERRIETSRRRAVRGLSDDALERIKQRAIDMVKNAPDGQKHHCVRGAARLLGGIQRRAGFLDSEAEKWLVDALPISVIDVENAKKTIVWGLERGRTEPIETR